MANLETIELTISANAESATKGIEQLVTSLGSLTTAVGRNVKALTELNKQLEKLKSFGHLKMPSLSQGKAVKKAVDDAKKESEYVSKGVNVDAKPVPPDPVKDALWKKQFQENMAKERAERAERVKHDKEARARIAEEAKAAKEAAIQRGQEAEKMVTQSSTIDLMKTKLQAMTESFVQNAQAGKLSKEQMAEGALKIKAYADKIAKAEENLNKLKGATEEQVPTINKLKSAFAQFASGITGFFSRIKRIATTMLIRSAIRGLIKSIKEGITNVREWAKINNHEFYTSMDGLKSKTNELKNALGASFAPVIQAIIPILTSLCNVIIEVANWMNQLISLLTGKSTWIKASSDVEGYTEEVKKSTGAVNDWLAAFDELNVMSSKSGGSGSGKDTPDYGSMFEETSVFSSQIREIADFIKENFEAIKTIAIEIGAIMIAWKLGTAFAEALPLLATIMGYVATAGTIAVTIGLTWLFANQFMKTGEDGWLFAEGLTTALGATAAWAIARKLIGGQAGVWAASITLAFSAITGIVANVTSTDVDAFSAESIKQNVLDALKMGAAAGIALKALGVLSGGWALVAAGGVALLTFGVVLGIKALTDRNHISVDSNLINLTEAECRSYVQHHMFTINPDIMINVTTEEIANMNVDQKAIEDAVMGMIGTVHVIKLGLADQEDYAEVKEQILGPSGDGKGGLIGAINKWINSAETMSQLTLKFTPYLVGSTSEEQNQWYMENISGWEYVKGFMNDLGKQLADEMVAGESGELIIKRPERVQALIDEINEISNIIAGTDASTEINLDFEFKMKDVDQTSAGTIIQYYKDYKEKIKGAAEEIRKTALTNQTRLVKALRKMLEIDPENPEIKQQLAEAEAGLQRIKDSWREGLEKAEEEMAEPGKVIMKEWFDKQFGQDVGNLGETGKYTSEWFARQMKEGKQLSKIISEFMKSGHQYDEATIEAMDLIGITKWEMFNDSIKEAIIKNLRISVEGASKQLKEAASIGIPASDVVKTVKWSKFTKTQQNTIISSFVDAYGASAIPALKSALPDLKATDIISVTKWDDFTNEQKNEMIGSLVNAYGASALSALKTKLPKLSASDIVSVTNWDNFSKTQKKEFTIQMYKSFGSEGIRQLKSQFPQISANDLIDIKQWNDFSLKTKFNFLESIKESFGSEEALNAAKESGIDVQKLVLEGMSSNDSEIEERAKEWARLIDENIDQDMDVDINVKSHIDQGDFNSNVADVFSGFNPTIVAKPTVSENDLVTGVKWPIEGVTPTVTATAKTEEGSIISGIVTPIEWTHPMVTAWAKTDPNDIMWNVQWPIEGVHPTVTAGAKTDHNDLIWNVEWPIEAIHPQVVASVTASQYGINDLSRMLKSALSSKISLKVGSSYIGGVTIKALANGGLVNSGDIFVANENGKSEMIGRFGNQTGVANQQQIVEGIQKGVADANREQNALLIEQNALLRGILNKSSDPLRASSALGRIASQSINMYNAATGTR